VLLAGGAEQALAPVRVQVLPTVDPQSLTQAVRADLPPGTRAVPGQFARLQLSGGAGAAARACSCRHRRWCAAPSSPPST
jgi:multidrug efflux pump subunit AcrA (membrane-fusion protein)